MIHRLAHVRHMCHPAGMAVMIQVRNVPDSVHRELVRRAQARGMSLTAYVQSILEREVGRLPVEEVIRRLHERPPIKGVTGSAVDHIRARRGPLPGQEDG